MADGLTVQGLRIKSGWHLMCVAYYIVFTVAAQKLNQQKHQGKEINVEIKIISKEVAYQGFFRLQRYRLRHSLFAGGWSGELVRECFERGHAVAVLPYDPKRHQVVLIEQFRIGALQSPHGAWLLETVAGMIEDGEAIEEVARREAVEEANCKLGRLHPVYSYLSTPGGCSEQISLFCGEVDASQVSGIYGLEDEGEDIRVRAYDFDEAMALLESDRIGSSTPIIALQWLQLNYPHLQTLWS